MWNLDDKSRYEHFARIELPHAMTYGSRDSVKRELIRQAAVLILPVVPAGHQQWAFRIFVRKAGERSFDLDNVPKLIVDAFCGSQILNDRSLFSGAELYPFDTMDHVVAIQIAGERCASTDSTTIEIFRRVA